jgi:hypothetical protein
MISRYKGDVFEGANRELKASILEAVMTREVTRYDDFRALLTEYGETRTRNAGRDSEYENVKSAGAAKGVNLKEFVFSREFIELDATAKREALESNVHAQYVEPGVPRDTPLVYLDALGAWHDMRAREIKYLNSGSSFYKTYQAASPAEQRRILEHREQRFYDATGGLNERTRERTQQRHDRSGHWRDWKRMGAGGRARERGAGREPERAGQSQQWWNELERAHREITGRWRAGADHDLDARFDRSGTPSQSAHRVHGMSGRGVDGDAARRQVLLPPDALLELGNQQAERIDALRWSGDRERAGRGQLETSVPRPRWREGADRDFEPGGSYDETDGRWQWPGEPDAVARSGGEPEWKVRVDRMFVAWDQADEAGRTRLARTGAEKFMRAGGQFDSREPFGLSDASGGSRIPAGFGPREEIRNLADVQSFDAIESLPFEIRPTDAQFPTDGASVDFNARARASTGRAADTVRDQFARDLSEARRARRAREREEFTEIRATLDAGRLLAALAHSHGLIVEKYLIGKGADGGDRIQTGSRNLNVSDFLTKEMNLSWEEAAQLLRETYRAQTGRDPEHAPRRTPEPDLWGEFQQWRSAYRNELRRAWDAQADHESERRKALKSEFYSSRSALIERPRMDLSGAQRREQLSAARVARLEAEAALRVQIAKERDALKGGASRPLTEQYRDFLQERAQEGDERALRELRRMQQIRLRTKRADDERAVNFSTPSRAVERPAAHDRNEIVYAGPSITYEVRASGEVDYRKDGVAFLVDEGRTLRLWDSEREAIEIALRFAQQKFGSTLSLSGPDDFQVAAARVAADTRMRIVFEQPELESVRQVRVAELDAEALERRAAQRERETWERDELRDAVRHPPPPTPEDPSNPDQDAGSPADPDAPGNGPDIDR